MNEKDKDKIIYVSLDDIIPNRFQPRLAFDEKELSNLATSIKKYGVIQPIVLRKIGEKYEIIAGERRYKASLLAGLKVIPSIINQTDDNTSAEIALLENIQRKNLTVIEEAQSYRKLMEKGFTQADIASKLGVSQSSIANKLRLLSLPKQIQNALLYNKISERHARSLLTLSDATLQKELLEKIISNKLTVKQTEEEIKKILNKENDIEITEEENKKDSQLSVSIEKLMDVDKSFNKPVRKEELSVEKSSEKKNEVEEFLDFNILLEPKKEEIIETPEIKEDSDIAINPFQKNFINRVNEIKNMNYNSANNINNKIEKIKAEPIKEIINIESNDTILSSSEQNQESNNNHTSVSLPKIIENVRNMISDYNTETPNLINTTELDLNDKYRIVIEINKNE